MWLSRQGTCSQTFYTTCDFFRRHTTKNMGNVDPKMGCKIWTPFWGPPNCFFLSRPPKRGPDFRPHFEVHIARFFFAAWRWKRSSPSRMLVSRFVFFTPHCWQCEDMWLSREGTCSQTFYTTCDFFRRHTTKNMGNVDPKMGCKIWTPFWGPPNCFFLSRPPKRGPDFRPHFEVHIARFFFRSVTLKKVIQDAHLHTMEDLGDNGPYPNVISQLALRILNVWVMTGSHPCNLLSLSYRAFASQVPPWPVEWSGQVAWRHQTCCHYPEWSRVGRCQNHIFQIGDRVGCLWAGSFSSHHIAGTGEGLA